MRGILLLFGVDEGKRSVATGVGRQLAIPLLNSILTHQELVERGSNSTVVVSLTIGLNLQRLRLTSFLASIALLKLSGGVICEVNSDTMKPS